MLLIVNNDTIELVQCIYNADNYVYICILSE